MECASPNSSPLDFRAPSATTSIPKNQTSPGELNMRASVMWTVVTSRVYIRAVRIVFDKDLHLIYWIVKFWWAVHVTRARKTFNKSTIDLENKREILHSFVFTVLSKASQILSRRRTGGRPCYYFYSQLLRLFRFYFEKPLA